jgi:hypothetical protein
MVSYVEFMEKNGCVVRIIGVSIGRQRSGEVHPFLANFARAICGAPPDHAGANFVLSGTYYPGDYPAFSQEDPP